MGSFSAGGDAEDGIRQRPVAAGATLASGSRPSEWAYNMEVWKKAPQPPDFNPYLGDGDVSSRSGNEDEDWDTWMGINGVGGVTDWINYE